MENDRDERAAATRKQVRQAYASAASLIAQIDRMELVGGDGGNGREPTRDAGHPAAESSLSQLVALHGKLVLRLHPCLGPVDCGTRWQYILARLALKRRDLPMMESLDALTRHLDAWDPLSHMDERELAAELALAEALVAVQRERLRSLQGESPHAA